MATIGTGHPDVTPPGPAVDHTQRVWWRLEEHGPVSEAHIAPEADGVGVGRAPATFTTSQP